MFDVLIAGGMVVDGSGKPGYRADVGVTGERVEAVGDLSDSQARRVIDATGHAVSPGFIDTHAHSDGMLLVDRQHAAGLRQGITTEILGQDGLSYAPLSAENYRVYRRYLGGILGDPPEDLDMSTVAAFRSHYHNKCGVNTAYLVAHGAVRLETVGFHDVPLVGNDLERAKGLIRDGIEQGAVGFATGMSYHPNSWSDTTEMIELCRAANEMDGVYVTHLRNVNTDRAFGGGGVPEALEIGRRSGVKVHFSHTRTGVDTAGQVDELVAEIDEAKAEGVDCTLELYPYASGSSLALSNLPSYANDGGPDAMLERLTDPEERAKLARALEDSQRRPIGDTVISYAPRNSDLEGMALSDIALRRGQSMGETLMDLLVEEDLQLGFWGTPPSSVRVWEQISRDSVELLSRPDYMVGSDSVPIGRLPHPRAYGTFPRFLGRLRRRFPIMSLEQVVQRMTDNAARRFGLKGRGLVAKGYFADLVVFDPDRIIDTATYDDPVQYPIGIPHVLVNGQVAVDHEQCTGVLAGQAVP